MTTCPFCAEKIKAEAIICKNCQKDLTTKQAKAMFKQQEKVKKEEELLNSLPPHKKETYLRENKRKSQVKNMWYAVIIFSALILVSDTTALLLGPLLLIPIWLHPRKEETWTMNRFKNWKSYKFRAVISTFLIIFSIGAFGANAQEKRLEAIKAAYPEPKIEILSGQSPQGELAEYKLAFRVDDGETAVVNGAETFTGSGPFESIIPLKGIHTTIRILAKNKYKQQETKIVIERSETEQEKTTRLAREAEAERVQKQQEAAQAAKKREWESTKAGQICKRHPDWKEEDCKMITDRKIWVGMTYDMLIELRGKPNSANPSNYGSGTQWQWCWYSYTPSCFYDNNDDGIIDIYN